MIILKNLEWSNCFSYGKGNKLTLDKDPIVQLVGKNGHGKSSIGLILEEVCYNKNSKGIKRSDVLNRHIDSTKYSIKLEFDKDGDIYTIDTTRGSSQTIKFTKNGDDISSHTATSTLKTIEEVIGLDGASFAQLIYQSSASSLEFLTATDTNRKKFLINLLNLEGYTKAHDIFKGLVKDLSTSVTAISAKIETVNSWIDTNKKIDLVEKPLQELPELFFLNTTEEANQISILNENIRTIEATNKRINQNNEYKLLLSKIPLEELESDIPKVKDISKESIEYVEVQRSVRDAKSFITKMGKLSDTCPTCSQAVDNSKSKELIKEQEDIIKTASEREVELLALIESAEKDKKWVERVNKYKTDYENYSALIDPTMTESLLDKAEISTKIIELQKVIKSAEQEAERQQEEIAEITAKNNKALAHNAKIDVISTQLTEYQLSLQDYSSQLVVLTDRLNILQILQKTFGTNGLVAYKIECMVKDLQNLTNQYLGELSDGRFQISFVISTSDKLNVVIIDNGTEIDILALSSGERARVNTATLLAIRKLMQTLSSVRINILILDETIDNLDIDGKEKLVEVLLKEEHLNTILVSHGYSHPLIEKVSVIKENNISRIE
jgi:DNA repair exonuclease SbcCD ATPase subunit